MEALLPAEFDATSVEPDGLLRVYYKSAEPEVYHFKDIKRWFWRRDPEASTVLVIVGQGDFRAEIPELGIRKLIVIGNTQKYMDAQEFIKSVEHVCELEAHLAQATKVMHEKREVWLKWQGTS